MKKILAVAVFLCSIQTADASFIDHDSYLTDTISGLDWLDVTATAGRTYNDVTSQFDVGGDFLGWRYATGDEFNGLVAHWTGSQVVGYGSIIHPEGAGSIDGLVRALGSTLDMQYKFCMKLPGMLYTGMLRVMVLISQRGWCLTHTKIVKYTQPLCMM